MTDDRNLSEAEYLARALPRLARIDSLSERVDFESPFWRDTPNGKIWLRLMDDQNRDEVAAGL